MAKKEIWKPVIGYEEMYEVSNKGRIRSFYRRGRGSGQNNGGILTKKPHLVNQGSSRTQYGYKNILMTSGGKSFTKMLHRVVLEAFVGPCPEDHEAAHLNGIRDDNRLENLKWVTHKENIRHRKEHGTATRGEKHPTSLLTDRQVGEIKYLLQQGVRQFEIADKYGVARVTISGISIGRSWKHIKPIKHKTHLKKKRFCKLSDKELQEIRGMVADGIFQSEIAEIFGVHQGTISNIVHNKHSCYGIGSGG